MAKKKDPILVAIARRVTEAMEETGTTREHVADLLDIGKEQVGRYLRGVYPIPIPNLRIIAEATGYSSDWFETGRGPKLDEAGNFDPERIEHLQAFVRDNPFPMVMCDMDMRVISMTDELIEGLSLEHHRPVEGKLLEELFERPSKQAPEYLRRARAGETPNMLQAQQRTLHDGRVIWLAYRTKPWYTSRRKQGGVIIICAIGDSKGEVEAVADISYTQALQPSFLYTTHAATELQVKSPTVELAKGKGELNLDNDTLQARIVDIVVSIIGEEVNDLITESQGAQLAKPFKALDFRAVKKVGSTWCRFHIHAAVEVNVEQPEFVKQDGGASDQPPLIESGPKPDED